MSMFVPVAQVHAAAQSEPGEQQPDDAAAVTLHAAHAGRAERGEQPAGGATARHPAPHQVSARSSAAARPPVHPCCGGDFLNV